MATSTLDSLNETLTTLTNAVPKVANAVRDWRFLTQTDPRAATTVNQSIPAQTNKSTIAATSVDYKMLAVGALAAYAIFKAVK